MSDGLIGCLTCGKSAGVSSSILAEQGGFKAVPGGFRCPICLTPEPIEQFFAYEHLPGALKDVSRPFGELAQRILANLPRNAERTVALRKLLEAKDAAVRAKLFK